MRDIDCELRWLGIETQVHEPVKVIGKTSVETDGAVGIVVEKYIGGRLGSKKCAGYLKLWKGSCARAVEEKVISIEELAELLRPELISPYYLLM